MSNFIIVICAIFLSVYFTEQTQTLSEEYINHINRVAKTWKAGYNFPIDTSIEKLKLLLGLKKGEGNFKGTIKVRDPLYVTDYLIPPSFDARTQWPNCTTIGQVRDQGNCGSCWAISTAGAFGDRLCVATNGSFNQLLSIDELTFCCGKSCGNGCFGGIPYKAWEYFINHGVVTGGNYGTSDGCEPYRIKPCFNEKGQYTYTCKYGFFKYNHKCVSECYGNKTIDYTSDHYKTKIVYYIMGVSTMQYDIMRYGPIEMSFSVFHDFFNYKSGVYTKTEGASYAGGHSVKLIGWGEEYGIPYWLAINSWGVQWGDNGLFKIRRGINECNCENEPTAGVPKVKNIY